MAVRTLRPGAFQKLFMNYPAAAEATAAATIDQLGKVCEGKAKENLAKRSHEYGTPSPAPDGAPPAMISGTLHGAVGRSKPARHGTGWVVKVGIARRATPWYSKTPAEVYGRIHEENDHPWLKPAFQEVARSGAGKIASSMMKKYWRR